jgi:hypothetical protein
MRITSRKVPAHLKPQTRAAVKFFAQNIPDDKKFNFSHIHVEFVNSSTNAEAWCDPTIPYSGDKPDEFTIEININAFERKIPPKQYTEILFHELTHAWQFATGKLVIENYRVAKFASKLYDLKEFEYFLQPWEVEAYGYQHCMNRLYWDM